MKNISIMKRRERLILLFIFSLAAYLRLFKLGRQSLWIDEINAVILAGKNIFEIILLKDTTPPFIYLINHFWQKLGNSDFMVRLPSMLLGIASIYAIYKLARALFGIREALLSSFLAAISLYHIIYSQEAARPYTAFILFSLLSFYCLYKMLNGNQRKYWAGFIIFNTLNLYTQFFAIFVLLSETAIWLAFISLGLFKKDFNYSKGAGNLFKFGLAVLGVLILSLPILMQFILALNSELSGGRVALRLAYYKNLLCRYGAGNGLSLFIYNFFFLTGIVSLFKGDKKKEVFLLIFCLASPFLVLSFIELKHFFHIRYVIFTYPLYIIIVSKGITNILNIKYKYRDKITYAIAFIFAFLSFVPLKLYYSLPARLADWRGAADYIHNSSGDGAIVITQSWQDTLIKYYLAKIDSHKHIEVVPHNNNIYNLIDILSNNYSQELYYVGYGGNDIGYGADAFCVVADKYLKHKKEFYSPAYLQLVKKELIDGDGNSWVDVGVRGYRLVVYSN